MSTVDTELENALTRAMAASTFTATLFDDIVTELVYPDVPPGALVNTPSFTGLSLEQPPDPQDYEIEAQLAALKAATDEFADTYFPSQPSTEAAIAKARTVLVAHLNGVTTPLASFMNSYLDVEVLPPNVEDVGLTKPRFYTQDTAYDAKLLTHYEAQRVLFRAKVDARLLVDFRKYATGLLLKVDIREEALRATTAYVLALGEVEVGAGENIVRLNQAKAAMASAAGKWFATQISNDVVERKEFATVKHDVSRDVVAGTAQYTEVEAKVRAAQAGASTLMEIAATARNTISAITSAAKVGFE